MWMKKSLMAFSMQSKIVHMRAYVKFLMTSLFVFTYALPSTVSAQITVFAASSITEAMKEIGERFTEQSGGNVRFNFASPGTLARQIEAGVHRNRPAARPLRSTTFRWRKVTRGTCPRAACLLTPPDDGRTDEYT
jgi:hypothetical protein